MRIRRAELGDARAIGSIYNHEVVTSIATFDIVPWTTSDERSWLERHQGAHPAVVAVAEPRSEHDLLGAHGEAVLGFGALSPYRERPGYATTVEDSVYVDARHRKAGIGRAILEELIRLASAHGFHTIIARIGGRNEASIALHRACGFEWVGVEREVGRKHGVWLDVVELQRML